MLNLIEPLAAGLERPREVTAQVVRHIGATYGVAVDGIGAFLVEELPGLEDDEIDLVLSPLYTPRLADQAVFAQLLGAESIPRDEWPGLVEQLVARPTRTPLVTSDGHAHPVALRAVTVERYVYRLRLDGTIPETLAARVQRAPRADRPMLAAVARRAIWESDGRRAIFIRYLDATAEQPTYRLDDVLALLDLVERQKPAGAADLAAWIPEWQAVLRREIDTAFEPRPFLSSGVEQRHGGARDQRQPEADRVLAKQNELAFLDRLHHMLAE